MKHFLVVTYPAQGHINPAVHLAKRLAGAVDGGARITFSTPISAHRKMFPDLASPDAEVGDGAIAYLPFSDGYDDGFRRGVDDRGEFLTRSRTVGSENLSAVIDMLESRGSAVDCVIYTFLVSWAADVARAHGIRSAQYWIQPATVFAIYYHSFHGYGELVAATCNDPSATVELPGLPPLRARELPSFVLPSDDQNSKLLAIIKDAFVKLEPEQKSKPKVLVNTFDELERDAISSVAGGVELIPVGPILQSSPGNNDGKGAGSFSLFKPDEKGYMEWLDAKAEGSVVYVSFGSMAVPEKKQVEEISRGLKASGRPYLWVARRDCRYEGDGLDGGGGGGGGGMIVEWCSQMRVLSHPAVGCFVTHCGWNSTLESLVCGVPAVGVPQWTDQGTNAMLVERAWGTGVRGVINGDGVLECDELRRCLDLVFGEGEQGAAIRRNAGMWKEKAKQAVKDGGSSDRNLRAFVDAMQKSDK